MTLSFFGAVRLYVEGSYAQSPPRATTGESELPPIDSAAWQSWSIARDADLLGLQSGDDCRLPSGERGLVTEVFEAGRWFLSCEVVRVRSEG